MTRIPWGALAILFTSVAFLSYKAVTEHGTKTHWVVMSTEQHPALAKLRDMSHTFEETLTILPTERSLLAFRKWLDTVSLQPNDIVIFTDASTIFQVRSQDAIRKRFLQFGKPIVFAGQESVGDSTLKQHYSPLAQLQPFPFLNPNAWVGRVWALRRFLETVDAETQHSEERVLTMLYKRHGDLATIDSKGLLFVTHVKKSSLSALVLNPASRTVTCRGTGTNPLIIQTKEPVVPFYAYFSV